MSENVFITFSNLSKNLAGKRILGCIFFSFTTLTVSFHSLLLVVSFEKPVMNFILFSVWSLVFCLTPEIVYLSFWFLPFLLLYVSVLFCLSLFCLSVFKPPGSMQKTPFNFGAILSHFLFYQIFFPFLSFFLFLKLSWFGGAPLSIFY